jgi:hypothetical protein
MLTLVNELRTRADGYEANRDSRCVFTRAYAVMTIRLARCLEDGRIADPEWASVCAGSWLAETLAMLRSPEGLSRIDRSLKNGVFLPPMS